jgi:type I site-specific restriction endonuclease
MGCVLSKKALSEADIWEKFINPALQAVGWGVIEQIFRGYTVRVGRGAEQRSIVTRTTQAHLAQAPVDQAVA